MYNEIAMNARDDSAIGVLVVDDHDPFRAGLASRLAMQPDIEVVAQASGGRMGIRLADELRPDVVLMDLRMRDLDGPEATRQILERNPGTRVLVLTLATDDSDVEAALEAGACGVIAKDTPVGVVAVALRAAAQGVAWLSPRAAELVLGRVRQRAAGHDAEVGAEDQLSAREMDVLRLIARGMENAEIAKELGIRSRISRIRSRISNILAKLGLSRRRRPPH